MDNPSPRDTLYAHPLDPVDDFVFDEQVVSVFSDMIRRSVPGYAEVVTLTGRLAAFYALPQTLIYDLGCSLGDTALSVARSLGDWTGQIIAVDNAPAMVEACRQRLSNSEVNAIVQCADIRDFPIENASVVTLNYTLQFIQPAERLALIKRIYAGMESGGALLVSEKIAFENPGLQKHITALHHAFKRNNGYSELEISQKRAALEKVLIPDTLDVHRERFFDVGFSSCTQWFQCLNFASMIAIK